MQRLTKRVIALSLLAVFVILYIMFVIPLAPEIGKKISEKNPNNTLIITLILTFLLIAVRFFKKWKKYEKTGDMAEWFALLFMPIPLSIEAIVYSGISMYWVYFPYVISSVFWIAIGVYKGGYDILHWDVNYQTTFVTGCIILVSLGVTIIFTFDSMYHVFPSKFFPWLANDLGTS